MSEPIIHLGPTPTNITLNSGQIILMADIYPDERSSSTGGFFLSMTVEQQAGKGVHFDPFVRESYPTVELAKNRLFGVAAERQVTDVYLHITLPDGDPSVSASLRDTA